MLAHGDLAFEIDDLEPVDLRIDDVGNILGDPVVVLHHEDRNSRPTMRPTSRAQRPPAADNMFGDDVTLLGEHVPGAVGQIDDTVENG